jgi:hypothetical protein
MTAMMKMIGKLGVSGFHELQIRSARALLLNRAFDIVCCFFDTGDGISALGC